MKSGLSGVLETVLGDVGDKFGDVGQAWVNVVKVLAVSWKQEAEIAPRWCNVGQKVFQKDGVRAVSFPPRNRNSNPGLVVSVWCPKGRMDFIYY